MRSTRFAAVLEEARASGRVLLDLTEGDFARCGLGWDTRELEDIARRRSGMSRAVAGSEAREAIAGYLAGHGASVGPDRIVLARSRREVLQLVLEALCQRDGEALVPAPDRAFVEAGAPAQRAQYRLVFEERWRIDRRSLQRAPGPRARVILVGNPADPTGASLSRDELRFLERLCEERGVALVGDETFLAVALEASPSVASAARCLAVHLGSLRGCGLPHLEAEWLAVAGPESLAGPVARRLSSAAGVDLAGPGVMLLPALLGRRESFLSRLRARLTRNRTALATASLREAPWTMQWGGGCWAVLQINPDQDEDALCLALLEEGVAVQPGYAGGFPGEGYLIVSLLPAPEVFDAALARLEERLRRPVSPSARA